MLRLARHRTRIPLRITVPAIGLLATASVALGTAGDLDPTFDGDGRVTTAFDGAAEGRAVAVQSNGKVVVAGDAAGDFALARYNRDGSLDRTFSGDGRVLTDFERNRPEEVRDLAIQPNGKIVAVGTHHQDEETTRIAVARYNPDGSLDRTFSRNGRATAEADFALEDEGRAVALDRRTGRIVISGPATSTSGSDGVVVALTRTGRLDRTFSGDGRLSLRTGGPGGTALYDVHVPDDGKIIVAGAAGQDFLVIRLTRSGTPDRSFARDGRRTVDMGSRFEAARSIVPGPGGLLTIVGLRETPNARGELVARAAAARLTRNGATDRSFGTRGRTVIPVGRQFTPHGAALDASGRLVIAGDAVTRYRTEGTGEDRIELPVSEFGVARLGPGGAPDRTFSADGRTTTAFENQDQSRAHAVALSGRRIVAAGTVHTPGAESSAILSFGVVRYRGR